MKKAFLIVICKTASSSNINGQSIPNFSFETWSQNELKITK
jgi:hypothetical protein